MIAFLSNINIDPIKGFFKEETYFAGFNQYTFELLDEKSMLYSEKIITVILFIDGEEFLKDLIHEQLPNEEFLTIANERITTLLNVIEKYISSRKDILFFINNIVLPVHSITAFLAQNNASFMDIESSMNNRIKEMGKRRKNFLIIDWQTIVKNHGYSRLHDDKFWYLGRIKLNNKALSLLTEGYRNLLNAYRGETKKVLVIDLDNTLWGGVIGEDGPATIKLSEEGEGKIFRDFQKIIKLLKQVGIILCINSKNNEEDVNPIFKNHPMMILKLEDFIIKKINWNDKVINLQEIANELNLGLDSFVFIDDNPTEREYIKKSLPAVVVPEFPQDITTLKVWFFESVIYKYFAKTYFGKEDLLKTDYYKNKLQRDGLSTKINYNEFIKNIEIKLKIYTNPTQYIQRISQLTQKTNQFNFTTKRYSELDIERYLGEDDCRMFALEYEDKFGKEGLTGVAILKINYARGESFLDTFLLSCRIIGKNVEQTFLYEILKILQLEKIRVIEINFSPTGKNNVAKKFYDSIKLHNPIYPIDNVMKGLKNKLLVQDIEIL